MERGKGEYLDMDDDKRRQLDQQSEEYVDDTAAAPAMNADLADDENAAPGNTPEPTES